MTWTLSTPQDALGDVVRERWRPRLRAGYMLVGDQQYYLYADKRARTLKDLEVRKFTLDEYPYPYGSVSLVVNGVEYDGFALYGKDLYIKGLDLRQSAPLTGALESSSGAYSVLQSSGLEFESDTVAELSYHTATWDDATTGITTGLMTGTFVFGAGELEYWFDDVPQSPGPIVITDDHVSLRQACDHAIEFTVYAPEDPHIDSSGLYLPVQLQFNLPTTGVDNPAFEINTDGVLNDWELVANSQYARYSEPYYGEYVVVTPQSGDYVQQQFAITGEQLRVTAWAKPTGCTGEAVLGLNFIDGANFVNPSGTTVGAVTDDNYLYHTVTTSITGDWTRLEMLVGTPSAEVPSPTGALPANPTQALLKLGGSGVAWDAVQVHNSYFPYDFGWLDPENVTVEYETDPTGLFVTNTAREYPFNISDVDVNPVHSVNPQGFLTWEPSDSLQDRYLNIGLDSTGEYVDWSAFTASGQFASAYEVADVPGHYVEVHYANPDGATFSQAVPIAYVPAGEIRRGDVDYDAATGVNGIVLTQIRDASDGDYRVGLTGTAAATGWRDQLLYRVDDALSGTLFEGVFLDVGESALTGQNNNTDLWADLVHQVKTYTKVTYPGQATFGVHKGYEMFDTGVYGFGTLAQDMDVLVADGIVQDRDLEFNTYLERQHEMWGLQQALDACMLAGNEDIEVLTLDFVEDHHDTVVEAEARHWAHREGWKSAVMATGEVMPNNQCIWSPLGYAHTVTPTGGTDKELGRWNLPYARTNGPEKLRPRGYFRNLLGPADSPEDFIVPAQTALNVAVLPFSTSYRESSTGNILHSVVLTGETVPVSFYVSDVNDCPLSDYPLYISTASGTFEMQDLGVTGMDLEIFTDVGGFAYISYTAPTGNALSGIDTITVKERRSGITGQILVDTVT